MRFSLAKIAQNPFLLDKYVIKNIHESDNMNMSTVERYFEVGRSAISVIAKVMICSGVEEVNNILDFACGFGRVSRYLRAEFPDADFTAADIWKESVAFNASTFSATAYCSDTDFSKINFHQSFDLIWCGSLITHIPEQQAIELLNCFTRHLKRGGLMVFTTHGRNMYKRRQLKSMSYNISDNDFLKVEESYKNVGYGFAPYDKETSYGNMYGISMTSLGWIYSFLVNQSDFSLKAYIESGWDNHQDVVAIRHIPA